MYQCFALSGVTKPITLRFRCVQGPPTSCSLGLKAFPNLTAKPVQKTKMSRTELDSFANINNIFHETLKRWLQKKAQHFLLLYLNFLTDLDCANSLHSWEIRWSFAQLKSMYVWSYPGRRGTERKTRLKLKQSPFYDMILFM